MDVFLKFMIVFFLLWFIRYAVIVDLLNLLFVYIRICIGKMKGEYDASSKKYASLETRVIVGSAVLILLIISYYCLGNVEFSQVCD